MDIEEIRKKFVDEKQRRKKTEAELEKRNAELTQALQTTVDLMNEANAARDGV